MEEIRCGLVAEVPSAGEDHGDVLCIASRDNFRVAFGAAGLNDGADSGAGGCVDPVTEREKCVAGHYGACGRARAFFYGEFYGVDTAHLAGANADGAAFVGEDDGVGFDMLADFPGELEVFEFGVGGSASCRDLEAVCGQRNPGVGRLCEDSKGSRTERQAWLCGVFPADQADIGFLLENFQRVGFKIRRSDDFEEVFVHAMGQRTVDGAVESDDAAECADRIGLKRPDIGIFEGIGVGAAGRIGVFDDGGCGTFKLPDKLERGIQIDDVVVAEFFAVELFHTAECGVGVVFVESSVLVRVFTVTKLLILHQRELELRGQLRQLGVFCSGLVGGRGALFGFEKTNNGSVVISRMLEGLEGEFTAQAEESGIVCGAGGSRGQGFINAREIARIGNDGDRVMVLGGSTNHGRAANIDILDRLIPGAVVGNDAGERIKIDDHQLNIR